MHWGRIGEFDGTSYIVRVPADGEASFMSNHSEGNGGLYLMNKDYNGKLGNWEGAVYDLHMMDPKNSTFLGGYSEQYHKDQLMYMSFNNHYEVHKGDYILIRSQSHGWMCIWTNK